MSQIAKVKQFFSSGNVGMPRNKIMSAEEHPNIGGESKSALEEMATNEGNASVSAPPPGTEASVIKENNTSDCSEGFIVNESTAVSDVWPEMFQAGEDDAIEELEGEENSQQEAQEAESDQPEDLELEKLTEEIIKLKAITMPPDEQIHYDDFYGIAYRTEHEEIVDDASGLNLPVWRTFRIPLRFFTSHVNFESQVRFKS